MACHKGCSNTITVTHVPGLICNPCAQTVPTARLPSWARKEIRVPVRSAPPSYPNPQRKLDGPAGCARSSYQMQKTFQPPYLPRRYQNCEIFYGRRKSSRSTRSNQLARFGRMGKWRSVFPQSQEAQWRRAAPKRPQRLPAPKTNRKSKAVAHVRVVQERGLTRELSANTATRNSLDSPLVGLYILCCSGSKLFLRRPSDASNHYWTGDHGCVDRCVSLLCTGRKNH